MKDFFLQMMNSNNPTVSSSRFLTVLTVVTVLYVWAIVSIYLRVIQDIPVGVYSLVGLVVAGKTVGMFAERQQPGTSVSTQTTVTTDMSTKAEKTDDNLRQNDRQ